jgi:hypothetical protein
MKPWTTIFLCLGLLAGLTACGSSQETAVALDQVEMLYYKRLGDEGIMAACNTQEGIDRLGQDYYEVWVGNAEIYNAQGEAISLDDLPRGCPLEIQWSGAIAESYPAQISATVVTALSDTPDPSVPPEDEIPVAGNGSAWWVPEPVTEVPDLGLDYVTGEFSVHMIISPRNGNWEYAQEEGSIVSGGATAKILDGSAPSDWTYDDNNTLKRQDMETVTLSTSPQYQTMTVTAYTPDMSQSQTVPLGEDGTLTLLEGDHIYVVEVQWEGEDYAGSGTYGFLVTES